MKPRNLVLLCLLAPLLSGCTAKTDSGTPRIVNIVNFIRLCEPRFPEITEDVLYETTARQVELMDRYGFRGTFLLQYDALMEPRYAELLKEAAGRGHEAGAWWEITQPHVERAGLTWRGRFPWDWHANVGFSTGYTPAEREKLVDVYMEDFKNIFGAYPRVVGCWFFDARTLAYMHEKYGVEAACNMKDQIGTDGYTLWGGYWAGAYYPSRENSYMPAQNETMQIPVPVFRMLGSDPIYQYDNGLGTDVQTVESLEAVYPESGGHPGWIRYFYRSLTDDPALGFTYAQTGQENSFTWPMMEKGLREQFAVLDSLNRAGKVRIEPLSHTARWFRSRYPVTPPTALSVLEDHKGEGRRTVWFDSRFYRANLLLENGTLRFRDIHLFDETVRSAYLDTPGTDTRSAYYTLPVVDGFEWSTPDSRAGLYLCRTGADGRPKPVTVRNLRVPSPEKNTMCAVAETESGNFDIRLEESGWSIRSCDGSDDWALVFRTPKKEAVPTLSVSPRQLHLLSDGHPYRLEARSGRFETPELPAQETVPALWSLRPSEGEIRIDCSLR